MNFVTLFNSNYLSRGITMYNSLIATSSDFHLYILAFDDITYQYLVSQNLANVTPISLLQFEDEQLLKIKPSRSPAEYCWTCSASSIYYCINKFKLDSCVYIDADLFFYANPKVLFDEWGTKSILITQHRFSKDYEANLINGKYCVQFVGFKNDEEGMKALTWWRNECIKWCFDRLEDGKFGDQKYLDDWPVRFKQVCDLEYLGGGVAPWNVQQYDFIKVNEKWIGKEKKQNTTFDLVFYHFHGLKIYTNGVVGFSGNYDLNSEGVRQIYIDYVNKLIHSGDKIKQTLSDINVHAIFSESPYLPVNKDFSLKGSIKKVIGKPEEFGNLHQNLYYLKDLISK